MAAKEQATSRVLVSHHHVICRVLSVSETTLISLTGKLFSKRIIDMPTKTLVLSKGGYKGADILLDHVEMKVESKPHILLTVLDTMKEHELLVDIVNEIVNWEGEDMKISGKLSSINWRYLKKSNDSLIFLIIIRFF